MDQIRDLELVGILSAKWEEAAENLLQQIIAGGEGGGRGDRDGEHM